jgi:hypothetical protein
MFLTDFTDLQVGTVQNGVGVEDYNEPVKGNYQNMTGENDSDIEYRRILRDISKNDNIPTKKRKRKRLKI